MGCRASGVLLLRIALVLRINRYTDATVGTVAAEALVVNHLGLQLGYLVALGHDDVAVLVGLTPDLLLKFHIFVLQLAQLRKNIIVLILHEIRTFLPGISLHAVGLGPVFVALDSPEDELVDVKASQQGHDDIDYPTLHHNKTAIFVFCKDSRPCAGRKGQHANDADGQPMSHITTLSS